MVIGKCRVGWWGGWVWRKVQGRSRMRGDCTIKSRGGEIEQNELIDLGENFDSWYFGVISSCIGYE